MVTAIGRAADLGTETAPNRHDDHTRSRGRRPKILRRSDDDRTRSTDGRTNSFQQKRRSGTNLLSFPVGVSPSPNIHSLEDVLNERTAAMGVRYDRNLNLVAINLDKLPLNSEKKGSAGNELQRRVEYAAELIRSYRERDQTTVESPVPSVVAYRTDGDFPLELVGKLVKAGGTFWRYMPGERRTRDVYADLLRSIRAVSGDQSRPRTSRSATPITAAPKENTQTAAPKENTHSREMSDDELELQKSLKAYRDDSFTLDPEALRTRIFGS